MLEDYSGRHSFDEIEPDIFSISCSLTKTIDAFIAVANSELRPAHKFVVQSVFDLSSNRSIHNKADVF